MTSTLSPADGELGAHPLLDLGDLVEVVLADVDDGEHRAVGEQEVRLRACSRHVGLQAGAVQRAALAERVVGGLQGLESRRPSALVELGLAGGLVESLLDGLEVGQGQLDLDDSQVFERVARAGDVVVDERTQHEHDRVDLADVGEELVAQTLALATRLRRGRRCRPPATAAWTSVFVFDITASRSTRSSGTLATPMFGSFVANA